MTRLSSKLKSAVEEIKEQTKNRSKPVWKGPEVDGVTQSLLAKFLVCRERFRLLVVEGLKGAESFYPAIDYGNMWHVCEEEHSRRASDGNNWQGSLRLYCVSLAKKFPMQQEQVQHWYDVCKTMFPLYVDYWSKHPDVKDRIPLLQEQTFDVPYKLPSGRVVRLRGKWDSVDLIGKGKDAGIYIQENKTKSSIDGVKIQRQLLFDLQTMLYVVALAEEKQYSGFRDAGTGIKFPIKGVRYNIVRRSAHKSVESMLKKFHEDKAAGRIGEWFARWKVEITPSDVTKFRRECLDPILEQLCTWWDYVSQTGLDEFGTHRNSDAKGIHWRHPYGLYHVINEGGASDVDEYMETGSEIGLQRVDNLFPEL